MSIAAAALALSRPFKFEDVTYQLKPLTYRGCAFVSAHLVERDRNAMRMAVNAGIDAATAMQAHLANVATGMYEPGGAAFAAFLDGNDGFRAMLQACIELPPGDKTDLVALTYEIMADPDANTAARRLMSELNSDPLARRQRMIPTL